MDVVRLAKENGMYYQAYSLLKDGISDGHALELRARMESLKCVSNEYSS